MANQDDKKAAEIVALARSVGLRGFEAADEKPAAAAAPRKDTESGQQEPTDETAAEVVALARSVGLQGFE